MSTASTITGIVPGVMAAGLLAENIKDLDFDIKPRKGKKKVNHTKRIVRTGVKNLVGIGLIGAVAGQVSLVP